MHIQRVAIVGAALLGASAVFMPWVSMPRTGPITGMTGLGWLPFLLFVVAAIAGATGERYDHAGPVRLACALVPAALAGALGVRVLLRFRSIVGPAFAEAQISLGIGPWVIVAAALAMFVLAFVFRARDDAEE
jgi:hypothetical protein